VSPGGVAAYSIARLPIGIDAYSWRDADALDYSRPLAFWNAEFPSWPLPHPGFCWSIAMFETLRRLWLGELPLHRAFWNWAVAGGLAVNAATSILFLGLIVAGFPVTAVVAGYACSVPYNVVVAVGVWRSAGRYRGEKRWADAARIVTVVGMTVLSVT
jgi:hypothetical protein